MKKIGVFGRNYKPSIKAVAGMQQMSLFITELFIKVSVCQCSLVGKVQVPIGHG